MHSLEAELEELSANGDLDAAAAARALASERREAFSLHGELRVALYVAVALVIAGVGILVKQHLDRIGPLTLMAILAMAAAACYVPAIRASSRGTPRSAAADYLLLLGALLVSADLGYAESQFHWLGANWSRQLLILTAIHAFTAYALESRLVLSVALTTLAGWFGIERGSANPDAWQFAAPGLGVRALLCATVMLGWGVIDVRTHAGRFRAVFEHFAANLAFWAALEWCGERMWWPAGIVALLVFAAASIGKALTSGEESFAVYGVVYTALGFTVVIVTRLEPLGVFGATLVLGVVLGAAAILRQLHDRLRDVRT
jgi:hypothetical protein